MPVEDYDTDLLSLLGIIVLTETEPASQYNVLMSTSTVIN